ncbi:MAG: hypothetical protein V3S55_08300 [Nitrospiraceae bacterium]
MADFIKDLTWLRRTFPPRGARGMPASLEEIVSPTVDILGTTRFEDLDIIQVLGTVGSTEADGPAVPSTEVWYILSVDVEHTDTTARATQVRIRGKNQSNQVALPMDVGLNIGLSALRRNPCKLYGFYLGPNENLRGFSQGIGAAFRVQLNYRWIPLPLGEYIRR